jgi:hypothetical protein
MHVLSLSEMHKKQQASLVHLPFKCAYTLTNTPTHETKHINMYTHIPQHTHLTCSPCTRCSSSRHVDHLSILMYTHTHTPPAPPAPGTPAGGTQITSSFNISAHSMALAVRYAACTSGGAGTGSSFCSLMRASILLRPSWTTCMCRKCRNFVSCCLLKRCVQVMPRGSCVCQIMLAWYLCMCTILGI